ncbi:hypothetical protein [Duganella sp. Root336D2]|uniref:hypothetical protein n=1 Tax=Duganella sp. Root336D2 TaxID=1736518 RepID=UPI0007016BFE|nr:hypothetical protein [Duganella sp. Root336D2]KQV61310.1 hypothetical protein ASD07_00100 [Duganella sp. Root336D2]
MFKSVVCKGATWLSAMVLAAPAAASPLAPFVLHAPGAVELKFSGYLARSADSGSAAGMPEASFGAGYMTSIHELGNPASQLWRSGQDNQSISFMMYGAADAAVLPLAGSSAHQVFGSGCTHLSFGCDGKIHLDFYLDKLSGGTNPGFGIGGIRASQRQGFSQLGGITDGALLMRWEFVPGLAAAAPGATPVTLYQQLSGLASPASGFGSYLARCTGGPACSYFSNGMQQAGADFYGTNTTTSILALTAIGQNGWSARLSDPVIAQVTLDQPATSALLPLGAAMLAWMRRRRQRGW